jgi:hypothetical protein
MTTAAIGAALKARLGTFAFTPAVPIAWPNKDFTPPTGAEARYLRVDFVRAPNERLTIKGRHRRSGSVVVTVASRANNGSGEGDGLADAVATHFPVDLILQAGTERLRITAEPSIRDGFLDGAFWRTPVIIPWEVI